MDCLREVEGKCSHDPWSAGYGLPAAVAWVPGVVIVGAGPSGLAVAACLKERGVPSLIIERSCCIASLWQLKTYDRLCLHLPKQFCELPLMAFPDHFPTYPSKQQFISYLEEYAKRFNLCPAFNEAVERAEYDQTLGLWRVRTRWVKKDVAERREYLCRWLVAATGENAEEVLPDIEGMGELAGDIVHTSSYRSGEEFHGKRVLVVGCGNSGMEVSLDLCNHNALPSLVVRDSVHILPRDMLGTSTFGLSRLLLNWVPIKLVDLFLVLMSRLILGDTASLGLRRPCLGPLQLKGNTGRTPVLDAGTLARIRAGDIKVGNVCFNFADVVFPGIKRLARDKVVEFVDGRKEKFDALILATGYKSNVPSWLMEREFFSKKDGFPRSPFPDGWKGKNGLYAVGFTKRGLLGTSMDANRIAQDIENSWRAKGSQPLPSLWPSFLIQNKGSHELEEIAKRMSSFIQWKDGGDSKDLCSRNPIASPNLETISMHMAMAMTKAKP